MTLPPDSMKVPPLDCPYQDLLRFASLSPSKRAYGVHFEFFHEPNPLSVKTYVNCPQPLLGAGFFISLFSKDLWIPTSPMRRSSGSQRVERCRDF
jgi:hypothetical protein